MSLAAVPISVAAVDDETGAQVRRRRTAMGMSIKALAEQAGVDRGRLAVLEDGGNVRLTTVQAVLRALDDLEHEMGMDVPSVVAEPQQPHLIEFEVTGDFGVRVVVKGPVENAAELEASVVRLIADMRGAERPMG